MNTRHIRSLLGVEFRRNKKNLLVALCIAVVGTLVLQVVGRASMGTTIWLLFVAAASVAIGVPMNIIRDKVTGQMEFTTTLPVPSGTLAFATFVSIALGTFPLAALAAWAINWMVLPAVGANGGAGWLLAAFLTAWPLASAALCLGCSALIRCDLNKLSFAPVAFLIVLFVFGDFAERWVPTWLPTAVEFLTNSDSAWILGTIAILSVAAAMLAAAFFVARQGFERYRPTPAAIDW